MTFQNRIQALIVAVVLIIAGAAAWGASGEKGDPTGIVAIGYNPDHQTVDLRAAASVADSNSVTTAIAALAALSPSAIIETKGRTSIPVSARWSVAGQTCKVVLVSLNLKNDGTYRIKDCSDEVTLSQFSTALTDASDRFMGPSRTFDTYGGTHVVVLLRTAPSSGTVAFGEGTY